MRLRDCTEIKVEMAEEGLLERLVITEEGNITESDREAVSSSLIAQSCSGESALKKEEEHKRENKNEEDIVSKMCLEEQSPDKQQINAEGDQTGEVVVTEQDTENANDGQKRGESESEEQTHVMMRINKKPEKPSDIEDEKVTQNDPEVDIKRSNSSELPDGTKNQEEDQKKVSGLLFFCFGSLTFPEITSIVTVSK